MERLTIVAGALGTLLLVAGAARAQAPNPPPSQPPATVGPNFVDANGDGVCDNCAGTPKGKGQKARQGRSGAGPGNGTGNLGVGPRDGSGYGQASGRGTCNGTGQKGRGRGARRG
jgi:hypothetical protein